MEVRYLILARYAEFGPDGRLNLIGGDHNRFVADSYPYIHPLLVAATRIIINREDCDQEHEFASLIIEENTGDLVAEGGSGTIPKLTIPPDAPMLGTGIILEFKDMIFPREGRYVARLIIDQKMMAEAGFRVAPGSYYRGLMEGGRVTVQGGEPDGSHDRGPDQ